MIIPSFTGIHHFLSNGHEEPFVMHLIIEGIGVDREYGSGEHGYQACKGNTESEHNWVRLALRPFGPDGAKKRGRRVVLRPTWEAEKLAVMRMVLDHKFAQGSHLASLLLGTGDAELIEGNDWDDTYWGICNGVGANWLGTLLMARRAVLRSRV